MIASDKLAAALASRNIHYGWVVASVTFLTMLISAGAVGAPGVFIIPLQKEFGWSTAEISSALATRLLLFGLMAPFAAALIIRFGLRRMMLAAMAVVTLGMLVSLGMTRPWQLFMLWGVVIGLGTGLTAMVLGATVATRWFSQRRGLVVGMLTAATATGQLVFLPAVSQITEHYGWRWAVVMMCGFIAFAALLVALLMRERPSDIGLRPLGETGPATAPPVPLAGSIVMAALTTLRDAAQTRTFWVLAITFFVCGASTFGLVQIHLIPMCADFGIPQTQAAGLLAAMGLFDIVGTIGSGYLSDRYDNRWLLFWYYALRGLSLLYLPYSDFTFYGLSVFAVFYGLDWIATVPPTIKLTAQKFGPERAGIVFGWVFAMHQVGAGAAAFLAGVSRTMTMTYVYAFLFAGVICIIAALLIFAIDGERKTPVLAPAE